MLDEAFEALKTFDWGSDPKVLKPIDDAIADSFGNADARRDLETMLLDLLQGGVSRAATDFICRKLTIIGTAASVPVLAGMLADAENSHMARYALERIPAPEAAQALREALPNLSGKLKIGVIGSLGARQDTPAIPILAKLLSDPDADVARAAAYALGDIRTPEAADALISVTVSEGARLAAADAVLACAEAHLANGRKVQAIALYRKLTGEDQPKQVRLAATRGMLAATGKTE